GNGFDRPSLQGDHHRVLDKVLGRGEVTGDSYECCGQPPGVLPHYPCELAARGRCDRVISVLAGVGHDSSGRISTTGQPGHVLIIRSASSRSATSTSV